MLLVEDEAGLARSTREYLEAFGLRAEHRATAEEALADLPALAPAVVLLDVGLPGMSGFALCSRLREAAPGAGVIFISARTSEANRRVSFCRKSQRASQYRNARYQYFEN